MDPRLGVGEPLERLLRSLARALRQARGVDQRADRAPVALRLPGRGVDGRVRGADRVPRHPLGAQLEALDAEPGQPGADPLRVGAGVAAARRAACRRRPRRRSRGRGPGSLAAPGRARDPRRDRARAEAVVDVDDRHARPRTRSASRAARSCRRARRRSRCWSARRSPARPRARRPPRRARRPGRRRRPRSPRAAGPRARARAGAGPRRRRPRARRPACRAARRARAPRAPPARPTSRRRRSSPARAPPARRAPTHASRARSSSSASGATPRSAARAAVVGAGHQHAAGVAVEQRACDRLDLRPASCPRRGSPPARPGAARGGCRRARSRDRETAASGPRRPRPGDVRCRHAATAGHRDARAQVARRAVALRARPRRGRPARALVDGTAGGRSRDARAGQLQRHLPDAAVRDHVGDVWYQTHGARAARAGRASGSSCASTPPRTAPSVWVDDTQVAEHEGGYTPFEADVTEHVRAGRGGPHHRRRQQRADLAVDPAGLSSRSSPTAAAAAATSTTSSTTPACTGRCGCTRTPRAHVSDVTVVTGLDGTTGIVAYRVDVDGGDGTGCASALRDADGAEVAAADGADGRRCASTDVHPWRPGRRLPVRRSTVELLATGGDARRRLPAAGRRPHRRGATARAS